MVKVAPSLSRVDTIGIMCPAGYMAYEKAETCIQTLHEWGYKTKIGTTLGGESQNYFSGNDDERLADLQAMLDDESIKAILFARGGYGIGRIIERISFKQFRHNPKWIIGYSDVTILHCHILSNYKIASLHSPMAAAFNEGGAQNQYVQSLKHILSGKKVRYHCDVHEYNRSGKAVGELIGGNLSLLAHIVGTSSDIKTKGRILFIEDVGEYLYNVDRMLYQLKRNGKLERLAGLIIGGFTDMKDTERPYGKSIYEIINEFTKDADYPVCYNFSVSHSAENYPLKVGVGHKLIVTKKKVTLEE